MERQQRWLCSGCQREWQAARVLVAGGADSRWWEAGDPCPGCGVPFDGHVELVAYTAAFAGGDIPREQGAVVETITTPPTEARPPLPLTAWPVRPTPDPPIDHARLEAPVPSPWVRQPSASPELD